MKALLKSRDLCLQRLDAAEKSLGRACDRLEKRIERCELGLGQCARELSSQHDREMATASRLVEREVRSKLLLSQWCCHFVAEATYEEMDPIAFAFCRLSLNVAATYQEVSYETLIQSNVHTLLVSLIGFKQHVIVGPAMLALCHLSLVNDRMKHDIVHAGALPTLLQIAVHNQSASILALTAKLIASLALHPPNKPLIASSGLLRALIDLSVGAHVQVSEQVRLFAVLALQNVTHRNDANRCILVELSGIRPLLQCIVNGADPELVRRSVLVFANVAYRSSHNVGRLLREAVDVAILETLAVTDVLSDPLMMQSCLIALTNCTTSARFRTHLAPEALPHILRVLRHSPCLASVTHAASLTSALVFDHTGNKAMFAAGGVLVALLDRLLSCCASDQERAAECADSIGLAAASLLLFASNHELFYGTFLVILWSTSSLRLLDADGLYRLLHVAKGVESGHVLRSLAVVVCSLVPHPRDLCSFHRDEFECPVEKLRAVEALKRMRYLGYDTSP